MKHTDRPSSARTSTITGSHLFFLLLVLFSFCFAVGCRKNPATQSSQPPPTPETNAAATIDKGDLKLSYQPRKTTTTHKVGSNPQAIEQVIANLNERIALPWDIVVSFEDCDEANAFYDAETRKLTLCYQLIDEYYDLF